jgi:hypothetical protein
MGWFFGGGRRPDGADDADADAPAPSSSSAPPAIPLDGQDYRRVKVHKVRRAPSAAAAAAGASSSSSSAAAAAAGAGAGAPDDADVGRLAALVPALAELSLAPGGADARDARDSAAQARRARLAREQAHAQELRELRDVYDMAAPNPVDREPHPDGDAWAQEIKPLPRRIKLSRYQAEMINYQRMLMRKNVWYYRDRAGVPRGPCPLHVLKDCWVQGVVDENTLVWGQGLADWLPARNVTLLVPMVRTPEVRVGAWLKKTFSLKPALERVRERRADARPIAALRDGPDGRDLGSRQVERMR